MNLQQVQKAWHKLGERAPLDSMLAEPLSVKIKGIEQYFAFGKEHTNHLMDHATSLGLRLGSKMAVDFGCGLGKSAQALVHYFDEVYGVDIAPSILEKAESYNRHPLRCKYILNESNDLGRFKNESVDLVCCLGVLSCIAPIMCTNYIREFLRILVPNGLLVFQMPSEPASTPKGFVFRAVPALAMNFYRRAKYGFEVNAMTRSEVEAVITRVGGIVLEVKEDLTHRVGQSWNSWEYWVSK